MRKLKSHKKIIFPKYFIKNKKKVSSQKF
jgi:hypothetical protein